MKLKFDWFLTGMALATLLAWRFPAPGAAGGWMHPELLTKAGIAQLAEEKRNWYRLTSAMNWMLEAEY